MKKFSQFLCLLLLNFIFLSANFELAEKAFKNQVYNFAIINYLKSLDHKNNLIKKEKILYRLIESYYHIKKDDQALKKIQEYYKSFANGKWTFNIRYIEARILFQRLDYKGSQKVLKKSIKQFKSHPKVIQLYFLLIEIYQKEKKYPEAIQLLKTPLGKYENDKEFLKATIYQMDNKHQAALVVLKKINKKKLIFYSSDEVIDLEVGIYLSIKDYKVARELIEKTYYLLKSKDYQEKFLFYQAHIPFLEKDYSKAIVNYKYYIEKFSQSSYVGDAFFFQALSYQRSHQPILALNSLEILNSYTNLSIDEQARKNKLNYILYKEIDQQDKQLKFLEKLLQPGSPEEIFALEEKLIWIAEKETDKNGEFFLKKYEKLETNSEKKALFYAKLADIYSSKNNSKQSIFFSQLSYDTRPDNDYLFNLANRLLKNGNYSNAISYYHFLENKMKQPKIQYLYDSLGLAYFKNKEFKLSLNYYIKNLNGENRVRKNAFFYRAENYRLEKKFSLALKYFKEFLKEYPKDIRIPSALKNIAFIYYYDIKDYQSTLRYLNQAQKLEKSPSIKSSIILLKFKSYLELGKNALAIEELKKISKQDNPKVYFESLLLIAKIFFNKNEYDKSLNQYYEIINSENSDTPPPLAVLEKSYFERVIIKIKQQSSREAYFYIQKLAERFPNSDLVEEGYVSVADSFYSKQKWETASKIYLELFRFTKDDTVKIYALFYLGFSQQQLGKNQKAYDYFKQIQKIGNQKSIKGNFYYDALFEIAIFEYTQKNYNQASKIFSQIIKNSSLPSLIDKSKKNLNIIESIKTPNPYQGIKTVLGIEEKIAQVNSPRLKDQGKILIAKLYYQTGEFLQVIKVTESILLTSSYYIEGVMLSLHSFMEIKDYFLLYEYAISNYLNDSFKPQGKDKQFFYYSLALASKQLGQKDDYEKFFNLLKKEFPQSEYLNE